MIRKMLARHIKFQNDLSTYDDGVEFEAPMNSAGTWLLRVTVTLIVMEIIAQIAIAHGALQ
jgi:hypothetical protein